jgi:hypothetical protein
VLFASRFAPFFDWPKSLWDASASDTKEVAVRLREVPVPFSDVRRDGKGGPIQLIKKK